MAVKKLFLLIFIIFLLLGLVNVSLLNADTLRPLATEDASTIEAGTLKLRLGAEYFKDKGLAFDTLKRDRELFVLPSLDISLGVGKMAELQVYFDGLYLDEDNSDSAYGSGDMRLFTKLQLKEENDFPAAGFKFGVKLPNAGNEDRLGTDEFDFFSWLLFSKRLGDVSCHLNLGLGILGNPYQNSNQDDVFCYGLGIIIPTTEMINLAFEVNGQTASDYNNDFSHALAGLQIEKDSLRWDLGAAVGLNDESEDWSLRCGLTKSFEDFIKF